MTKRMKRIADACLCHRALHAVVGAVYAAGWGHVMEHGMVMAAVVYAVMAVRG